MSSPEMLFILLLALIVFGPKKLPEIARQIGRVLNEFKRASNEFRAQIETEIAHLDEKQKRQILPPAEPPKGVVPAIAGVIVPADEPVDEPAALPAHEAESLAKAPDA
jgi:sec-independent protein translocase protein TatB